MKKTIPTSIKKCFEKCACSSSLMWSLFMLLYLVQTKASRILCVPEQWNLFWGTPQNTQKSIQKNPFTKLILPGIKPRTSSCNIHDAKHWATKVGDRCQDHFKVTRHLTSNFLFPTKTCDKHYQGQDLLIFPSTQGMQV